jgi:hypothetical protein
MKLQPHEIEIVGTWIMKDGKMIGDDNERRISWIIENAFEELGKGEGGWSTLYQDRDDQRLWDLTYPQGEMHGGRPRRLGVLSLDEVARKYGLGRFA